MPIHASAVERDSKGLMFAGTGGVGKSSTILELSKYSEYKFVADDICVIDENGRLYGNMAWPKIYGYNITSPEIKNMALKNRGWLDKMIFELWSKRNPARIRRKVKPDQLFDSVSIDEVQLFELNYIFREKILIMQAQGLNVSDFVKMTKHVMLAEYSNFHNHLRWCEYNSIARGVKPLISMKVVEQRWESILSKVAERISLRKISVPIDMSAKDFSNSITEYL